MTITINGTGPITGSDRAGQGANSDITALSNLASVNGGQLAGFRNKLINGSMIWDQRNSGTAVTPSTDTYVLDRWRLGLTQASKITVQQVADSPAGFQVSTKLTVASSTTAAAGNVFLYGQLLEGLTTTDMQFGLATAQTATVSFYIKGSVPGTYSASLRNALGTRSFVFTFAVTTVWARVSITIPGDTIGTWAIGGANLSMRLEFDLGSGSTIQTATPGSWLAGTYTAATVATSFVGQIAGTTMNITGVQLELGNVATAFEQRNIALELIMCQRYYERTTVDVIGSGIAGCNIGTRIKYAVVKRSGPGVTQVTNNANFTSVNIAATASAYIGGAEGLTVYRNATATAFTQFSEVLQSEAEL